MAAFSLNSTKNLPAGEGGLFATDSEALWERAARVRFDGLGRRAAAEWRRLRRGRRQPGGSRRRRPAESA